MKKVISVILLVFITLSFALVGCNEKDDSANPRLFTVSFDGGENIQAVLPEDSQVLEGTVIERPADDSLGFSVPQGFVIEYIERKSDMPYDFSQPVNSDLYLSLSIRAESYKITYTYPIWANFKTDFTYSYEAYERVELPIWKSTKGIAINGWSDDGERNLFILDSATWYGNLKLSLDYEYIVYDLKYFNLGDAENPNPTTYSLLDNVLQLKAPIAKDGREFSHWRLGVNNTSPDVPKDKTDPHWTEITPEDIGTHFYFYAVWK